VPLARAGPVTALWEPATRRLRLEFRAAPAETRAQRDAFEEQVRGWVGFEEPYVVIACCENGEAAPVAWRVFWAQFFRASRHPPRVACFGLTPSERFFMGVMGPLMRMDAQAFPSEGEALAWLETAPTAT